MLKQINWNCITFPPFRKVQRKRRINVTKRNLFMTRIAPGSCRETCFDVCVVVDVRQLFTYTCFAQSTLLPGAGTFWSLYPQRATAVAVLAYNSETLLSWPREQFFWARSVVQLRDQNKCVPSASFFKPVTYRFSLAFVSAFRFQ